MHFMPFAMLHHVGKRRHISVIFLKKKQTDHASLTLTVFGRFFLPIEEWVVCLVVLKRRVCIQKTECA